eukprot:m.114568 g.114568  ORF g.114568 m.114568 type:complete len:259 (+) comp12823_c0_seq3:1956-2732(+)
MKYHSSSSFFTLITRNGNVACYDIALNAIKLATSKDAEYTTPFSLDLSKFHLKFKGIASTLWLPNNISSANNRKGTKFAERLVVVASGGTPFFLHFSTPASSILQLRHHEVAMLCLAHLRVGQLEDAVALAQELDWTEYPQVSFHVFHTVISELLQMKNDPNQLLHLKNCIPPFAISPSTSRERTAQMLIVKILQQAVSELVANNKYIDALSLVTDMQHKSLCEKLASLTSTSIDPLQITVHHAAQAAVDILESDETT